MGIKNFLKEHLSEEQLEPLRLIKQDVDYTLRKNLPEEYMLKRMFKERMGYPLNLENPQTFNEKLQWLKLHDRNPLYTTMVDKYEVKKYVAEKIGEQYIIPTLGVWDHFDEIDFDKLPEKFVLKCTHDSGSVVLCRDKANFDKAAAKRKLERGLARNYYYGGYEWPYKNVKPRIIAEKFMVDESSVKLKKDADITDYKVMCFNGEVHCTFTCTDRRSSEGLKVTFFDNNWNKLPFERHYPSSDKNIEEPKNFQQMKMLAEKLSESIPFVRVDFYEISGNIYFGELTFYPGSGMEEFNPAEWDKKLGDKIHIEKLSAGDNCL